MQSIHDDYRREQEVHAPSERSFGFLFAGCFAIVAVWPLLGGQPPRNWALLVSLFFLLVTLFRATLLAPLNQLWLALGLFLHRIVSPGILAFLYYAVVLPLGLLMRLTGKRPLALRLEPDRRSYWIPREPPGPPPDSMRNQF